MKVLFLGGDKRQLVIINHFLEREYEIDVVGYSLANLDNRINKITLDKVKIDLYDIVILPVSGVKENYQIVSDFENDKFFLAPEFLKKVKDRSLIFTGIRTKELDEMLRITNKDAIPLMDDDDVKRNNSIPTVEGIIGDIIYNTEYTIYGARIFVLGYGNVGKLLTEKLKSLGAIVTVGVLLLEDYKALVEQQTPCIYTNNQRLMENIIQTSNVVVNTVSNLVLNKEYLEVANKDIYILDISSHPHGVDFKTADELQLKNKLLLGIPGNVAPKTAGTILVNKIESILERSKQ